MPVVVSVAASEEEREREEGYSEERRSTKALYMRYLDVQLLVMLLVLLCIRVTSVSLVTAFNGQK